MRADLPPLYWRVSTADGEPHVPQRCNELPDDAEVPESVRLLAFPEGDHDFIVLAETEGNRFCAIDAEA